MSRNFTFDITDNRYEKVKSFVDKNKRYPSIGYFINYIIDKEIDNRKEKILTDFIYYIGFPFLCFIGCIGLTFYFNDFFFYIISGVIGIYLIILCFVFYKKYFGEK